MISRVVHCYYYNYIDIKMKDREIGEAVFFFFFRMFVSTIDLYHV